VQDRLSLLGLGSGRGGADGFSGALDTFGGERDPGQVGEQRCGLSERGGRTARAVIARSPGDSDTPATPSCSSRGSTPRRQGGQW
jgi:hypothetical protein